MEKSVTIVLTSCGRADLLKKTVESFLKYNTYPIHEWIITEDTGVPMKELMDMYPTFTWIVKPHRGQIACIDDAYSRVKTPYIFHMEDDWESYSPGVIEASFEVLSLSNKVSAVMCRSHDPRVYKMSDTPPFLDCWGGWGYYSFNPGLRRTSDFKTIFNGSFAETIKAEGLTAERGINDMCRNLGLKMALTFNPLGYLRHIGDDRHVQELIPSNIRIGLNMIVKNESHVIEKALEYTLPLIDTYCIVDTGSTDNTIEVIKNFYKKHNITGEIHQRPWKNFGHNRSEALKLCDGKMEYILVMDADDVMKFPQNSRETLYNIIAKERPDVGIFTFRQTECTYKRGQLFKANAGWRYVGVLHEYPTRNGNIKEVMIPDDIYMSCGHSGDRNKDPNKQKKDIEVLLKGIKEEPTNERYVFYLAQTYFECKQIKEAIKWYTKRYEMGGWAEDQSISAMWISRLLNSKEWAWKSHECNPKRIEGLVYYMIHCRTNQLWSRELLAMALYASEIPKPDNQTLFLEPDIYDWRVWDELSIIAYHCGEKGIAKKAALKLLEDNKLPESEIPRIRNNLNFS
jgi:glycosyltransferase involved in cell wall biosynthesis